MLLIIKMSFFFLFSKIVETFKKTNNIKEVIKTYREETEKNGKIKGNFIDLKHVLVTFLPNRNFIDLNSIKGYEDLMNFKWNELQINNEEDKTTAIYLLLFTLLFVTDPSTNEQGINNIKVSKSIHSLIQIPDRFTMDVGVSPELEDYFDKSLTEIYEKLNRVEYKKYPFNVRFCQIVNKYFEENYPTEVAMGKVFLSVNLLFPKNIPSFSFTFRDGKKLNISLRTVFELGKFINNLLNEKYFADLKTFLQELSKKIIKDFQIYKNEFKEFLKKVNGLPDIPDPQKAEFSDTIKYRKVIKDIPIFFENYNSSLIHYHLQKAEKHKDLSQLQKVAKLVGNPLRRQKTLFNLAFNYFKMERIKVKPSESGKKYADLTAGYDEAAKDNIYVLYNTDIAREIYYVHSMMQEHNFDHLKNNPKHIEPLYVYVLGELVDFVMKQLKGEWKTKGHRVTGRNAYYPQIRQFLEFHWKNKRARRSIYTFHIMDKSIQKRYFPHELYHGRSSIFKTSSKTSSKKTSSKKKKINSNQEREQIFTSKQFKIMNTLTSDYARREFGKRVLMKQKIKIYEEDVMQIDNEKESEEDMIIDNEKEKESEKESEEDMVIDNTKV